MPGQNILIGTWIPVVMDDAKNIHFKTMIIKTYVTSMFNSINNKTFIKIGHTNNNVFSRIATHSKILEAQEIYVGRGFAKIRKYAPTYTY